MAALNSALGSPVDFQAYPVYEVQVLLADSTVVQCYVANAGPQSGDARQPGAGPFPTNGLFDTTAFESSFLSTIETWTAAQDYSSWSSAAYLLTRVTRFDETATDLTSN